MAALSPKPDSTELVILAVLADGARYGYAIAKLVAARSEGGLRLTPGILYPSLSAMERLGLIRSEWETIVSERSAGEAGGEGEGAEEEGGAARGRRRKWYSLTAKGRRRLEQRIRAHREHQALIDLFIAPIDGARARAAR